MASFCCCILDPHGCLHIPTLVQHPVMMWPHFWLACNLIPLAAHFLTLLSNNTTTQQSHPALPQISAAFAPAPCRKTQKPFSFTPPPPAGCKLVSVLPSPHPHPASALHLTLLPPPPLQGVTWSQLCPRLSNHPCYVFCHLGYCEHMVQVQGVGHWLRVQVHSLGGRMHSHFTF